jgi:hypothetical protein
MKCTNAVGRSSEKKINPEGENGLSFNSNLDNIFWILGFNGENKNGTVARSDSWGFILSILIVLPTQIQN